MDSKKGFQMKIFRDVLLFSYKIRDQMLLQAC